MVSGTQRHFDQELELLTARCPQIFSFADWKKPGRTGTSISFLRSSRTQSKSPLSSKCAMPPHRNRNASCTK